MTLINPILVLLGVSVLLLVVSVTLSLLLRKHPSAARVLFLALMVSLAAFVGMLVMDVSGAGPLPSASTFALAAAAHRRLLSVLPVVLMGTALVVVSAYHEELSEKHAKDYRNAVFVCTGASLIAVILIAIESVV